MYAVVLNGAVGSSDFFDIRFHQFVYQVFVKSLDRYSIDRQSVNPNVSGYFPVAFAPTEFETSRHSLTDRKSENNKIPYDNWVSRADYFRRGEVNRAKKIPIHANRYRRAPRAEYHSARFTELGVRASYFKWQWLLPHPIYRREYIPRPQRWSHVCR